MERKVCKVPYDVEKEKEVWELKSELRISCIRF